MILIQNTSAGEELMILISTLLPLIFWALYGFLSRLIETRRPSMSSLMAKQRLRWVQNAVQRDTPLDGILTGNIMNSVGFFASTSVLLFLAMFAVLGKLDQLLPTIRSLSWGATYSDFDYQLHLIIMLVMVVLAFLSFTLSLRQFNHFCILLGAADHSETADPGETEAMAQLNAQGARYFNNGMRAYYFSIANVGWFISPEVGIALVILTFTFIAHREFMSTSHHAIARLPQPK